MCSTAPTLNQDQKDAAEGFFRFLLNNDKELIISGPGGVGKTFLMGHMIDVIMPQYHNTCSLMGIEPEYDEVVMTATTNKAAEVLSKASGKPTQTIHSYLRLQVRDDYKTGKSILSKKRDHTVLRNKIIFVDEASMIDYNLHKMIQESTYNCKIIYVGDHCQLSPVMEPISPIYLKDYPFHHLTQQMRNNDSPALMNVCQQLRDTVDSRIFQPIQIVPGVIDHADDDQMQKEIHDHFLVETDSRILAYTNRRVVAYNDYIRRDLRQLNDTYIVGERLISNSAVSLGSVSLSVEEEVLVAYLDPVVKQEEIEDGVFLDIRHAELRSKYGYQLFVKLPEDKDHFNALIKHYQRNKDWVRYFHLKNTYPDLRPRDASTIHKAQGSTYDGTVFIDLTDLSTCRDKNQAARLLYVAFSRARNRVVLYGDLAEKFGGLTT